MPHTLPTGFEAMVGRDEDAVAARSALERSRLVTITGPGGVGKTRLAVAVGTAMAERDVPVVFVPLAGVAEAEHAVTAIAEAAGFDTTGDAEPVDLIVDGLCGRAVVLVLDNLEHLLDIASSVQRLLERCADLRVLTTSRVALRIRGESEYRLAPLELPHVAVTAAADLLGNPSVALLVREARRVDPAFTVDDGNADAVVEVCRALEGLPLAIELAAARLRLLSPVDLAAMLGSRLDVLRSTRRDTPPHHQTLRAAIDWSYRLLSPDEQRALRWCTVFAGGFSLEALSAAMGTDRYEVLDQLEHLVDHHLVRVVGRDAERRFDVFDSIREFGHSELEATGDEREARDAHARWVTSLVEQTIPVLKGAEQMAGLAVLDADLDNIRAALAWTSGPSTDPAGLHLASTLWRYWWMHGSLTEGRAWTDRALAGYRGELCGDLARTLLAAGDLAAEHADPVPAEAFIERAHEHFEVLGDDLGVADCRNSLAVVLRSTGDLTRAESLHLKALDVFNELGEQRKAAAAASGLAAIAYARGDLLTAETRWRETAELMRSMGDERAYGMVIGNVASAMNARGDAAGAVPLYEEALEIAVRLDDTVSIAHGMCNLGGALVGAGELDRAEQVLADAVATARRHGMRDCEAVSLHSVGRSAKLRGELRRAGETWLECVVVFGELGYQSHAADAADTIAQLGVATGQITASAPLAVWAELTRDRLGTAPESGADDVAATRAVLVAELGDATLAEVRLDVGDWSLQRVVTDCRAIVAALPERAAPRRDERLQAAKRAGLTARELEIVDQLVARQTDAEIAAALFVSVRTVTTHVSAVLRKLGVASRRDVAARAAELDLLAP